MSRASKTEALDPALLKEVADLDREERLEVAKNLSTWASQLVNSVGVEESSGDLIKANYWIKIGLTRSQVKALTKMAKRWRVRKSPCAEMARYLVSLALIHQEDTEAKLNALLKYMEDEGFRSLGTYCEGAAI